jgi:Zn-dependent peptidase ImmA (M78 family)
MREGALDMLIQAERVIEISRNFVHMMKLDKKPLPVDIEALIDKFGVQIIFRDFPKNFDALLTVRKSRFPLIIANSAKPKMRIRFSLAHEFGHYLLPWHYWERVYLGKKALHFESEYHLEIEANIFAGEVLMPFEKFYPLAQDPKVSIEELSDIFKTSIPALRKRYDTIIKYYPINGSQ